MSHMDGLQTYSGGSPKTPRTYRTSPTFEQLLRGESPRWITATSPTSVREHYEEEDYIHHNHNNNKKSVLTKVKERAKKLRFSLSKKKLEHGDNVTPSWGVSLDDDEEEDNDDEDPEYLGAPMYESELAPEGYRDTARQHPRAIPVVSENHVMPSSLKNEVVEKKPISPPNKTITETVSEKLAPAYVVVSDATQTIASKLASLTVATSTSPDIVEHNVTLVPKATLRAIPETRDHTLTGGNQTWDKGISVKEYFMKKLEPSEDERAFSQVIIEAISPKKSPSEMGMVEKVREDVNSLLRNDDESSLQSTATTKTTPSLSSPVVPLSINVRHEVVEEENQGRILQAN